MGINQIAEVYETETQTRGNQVPVVSEGFGLYEDKVELRIRCRGPCESLFDWPMAAIEGDSPEFITTELPRLLSCL